MTKRYALRFEDFTATRIHVVVFWVMIPYGLSGV
jgi:hypothetical protein